MAEITTLHRTLTISLTMFNPLNTQIPLKAAEAFDRAFTKLKRRDLKHTTTAPKHLIFLPQSYLGQGNRSLTCTILQATA
jgi:hypothetical protein